MPPPPPVIPPVDTTPPTITSASTASTPENDSRSMTLTASEAFTWAKVGGADQALFVLSGATLSLSARDYKAPTDADANNAYVVQVRATDPAGNVSAVQTITITVTDVAEGGGFAFVTDATTRPPPTTGTYAYSPPYGNFKPGGTGFPALGASYVDPVFGLTVRRITNTEVAASLSDLYPKNGFWNADASYLIYSMPDSTVKAVNALTGAVKALTNPGGSNRADAYCSPVNPDIFRYQSGQTLREQSISTGTVTTIKNFGTALRSCGGSHNLCDLTDRYIIVNLGTASVPSFRIWDKQTDTLFTGAVTQAFGAGYVAMAPDASCMIHVNGNTKRRYAIDTVAQTLDTTGFVFHSRGGDHGAILKASDGKVYFGRLDNDLSTYPTAVMLRIDVTTGTETVFYTFASGDYWTAPPNHLCAISKGPLQDWVFCSSDLEGGPTLASDNVDGANPVGSWGVMQNEIYMLNMLTGARRRLAHTRGREATAYYQYQPRVCPSWGGERAVFDSNMGVKSNPVGYVDAYCIDIPA